MLTYTGYYFDDPLKYQVWEIPQGAPLSLLLGNCVYAQPHRHRQAFTLAICTSWQ